MKIPPPFEYDAVLKETLHPVITGLELSTKYNPPPALEVF